MTKPRVLVIIPAYNEEKSVGKVIADLRRFCPEYDVVVINDGSRDNTAAVARAAGAQVIDLPFNLGIGGAMQTGYLYAYRNGYDIAVQMDADGQHEPGELPKIMAPLLAGEGDMIVGSRFVAPTGYRSPVGRRMGIWFLSFLLRLLSGQWIKDTTSGFRAVNREIIRLFAHYYPTDYPEPEVLIVLDKLGFRILEVPVEMKSRQAGSSSITPLRSLYYMVKVSLALLMNVLKNFDAYRLKGETW